MHGRQGLTPVLLRHRSSPPRSCLSPTSPSRAAGPPPVPLGDAPFDDATARIRAGQPRRGARSKQRLGKDRELGASQSSFEPIAVHSCALSRSRSMLSRICAANPSTGSRARRAQRAVVWAWRGPVASVPFPAGMDFSQAGILFPAARMVASRSGTGVAQSNSANGASVRGRGVSQDHSADLMMTGTRDRRVSQRAVDGQPGLSISDRVPLSSAARHLGLSPAVSATRAPSAPLASPRFFLADGTARPVTAVERRGRGSPPARVMRRLSSACLRASARLTRGNAHQSKFARPGLDDDALHPRLRDELLLLRSDDTEEQSMLVVVLAGCGDGSREGGGQLLSHDEAPVSAPHCGRDRTTFLWTT